METDSSPARITGVFRHLPLALLAVWPIAVPPAHGQDAMVQTAPNPSPPDPVTLPLPAPGQSAGIAASGAGAAAEGETGAEAIPDFYKEPGLNPNRNYANDHPTEHIDPFTGSLQLQVVDLVLPGNGGFDLKVQRSYNSGSINWLNPFYRTSLMGLGWTFHFGRIVKSATGGPCANDYPDTVKGNPVLELPDGSRQILAFAGGASPLLLTAARWRADCNAGGTGAARSTTATASSTSTTNRRRDPPACRWW